MIRIRRPAPPAVLTGRGKTQTEKDCLLYTAYPDAYQQGTLRFEFHNTLYGHSDVKRALREAQHGKCAFCESKIEAVDYGDVEHFRPKGGYCTDASTALCQPGYYWLAYEWTNLLFCCTICNQKYKQNLFPLKNEQLRARSHDHDITREEPLLIDPATQDPEQYLSFRKETIFAIDGNEYGNTTIRVCGLDREELEDQRRIKLQVFESLLATIKTARQNPTPSNWTLEMQTQWLLEAQSAEAIVAKWMTEAGEYAGMLRATYRAQFPR